MNQIPDYQTFAVTRHRPFAENLVRVMPWAVGAGWLGTCLRHPTADPLALLPQFGAVLAGGAVVMVCARLVAVRQKSPTGRKPRATRLSAGSVPPSVASTVMRPARPTMPLSLQGGRATASAFNRRPYPEEVIDMVFLLFGQPYEDLIASIPGHSSRQDVEAMAERYVAEHKLVEEGRLLQAERPLPGKATFPVRGAEFDFLANQPRYLANPLFPQE